MQKEHEERYMRLALEWARSTRGQTSPNPLVGAVIVNEGRIVGMGAHLGAGMRHAEVHALEMAGREAQGATMYVTLEPCNHQGRTPPCTEAIIRAGIARVVIGCMDENPRVAGTGMARLRRAGIEIVSGVLESECRRLNEAFFHYKRSGRPFIAVKTASTLDGKIATPTGDSQWVTGTEARAYVHQLRHEYDAVMVGIGTVLADDPRLTCRIPGGGLNPLRVIVDSRLRLPLDARVCDTKEAPTWVFCTAPVPDPDKERALASRGVRVLTTGKTDRVDLAEVFHLLGQHAVTSVLVEGGSALNGSLLKEGLMDKVVAFIAPKLLGGRTSLTSYGGAGWARMGEAVPLSEIDIQSFGEDLCIIGYPQFPEADEGRSQ